MDKRDVAAVNRTRGSCMASTNFTTKPLRLTHYHVIDLLPVTKYMNAHSKIYSKCVPNAPTSQSLLFNLVNQIGPEGPEMGQTLCKDCSTIASLTHVIWCRRFCGCCVD